MFNKFILPLILLLAFSACVTDPEEPAVYTPASFETEEPAPSPPEVLPEVLPESLPEPRPDQLPESLPEPRPESLPELDPANLIGADSDALQAKLGEPVLRRREGQIEVWQYRMQNCIIDFILPDGETVTALQSRHPQRGETYEPLRCHQDMARLAGDPS